MARCNQHNPRAPPSTHPRSACAMETPSNAEALSLLARTTLGAFLEERGCGATTGAQPIVLDADASVGLAMEARARAAQQGCVLH